MIRPGAAYPAALVAAWSLAFAAATWKVAVVAEVFAPNALLAACALARAQDPHRPPIGGIGSAVDAMIFYVAKGPPGACGEDCSEWIAAEGAVQFDTHKRLINILDRLEGRKLPLVINARGRSNLNVAASLGRILRERGIDTLAGPTMVKACRGIPESVCFTLKRLGGPLIGVADLGAARCGLDCLLILAGGVHRSLSPEATVAVNGRYIANRLAPNVSDDRRQGLTAVYGEQLRTYLRDMGVDTELVDISDRVTQPRRATELAPADWQRLKLVTSP
jgi:hypothetical protein